MDMRVSDSTRRDTWEMMLDLERQVRYYLTLADRYMLRYRALRYLTLLGTLGLGAAVYFLSAGPQGLLWSVAGVIAFALGFMNLFDAVTSYAERAAGLRAVHLMCSDLKTEAEQLWRDIEANRVKDDEAEKRHMAIMERWHRTTLITDEKIHRHDNVRAAREASEIMADRYAR